MSIEILTATTSAGNSGVFEVNKESGVASVILHAASGLTAGEYADVQVSHDSGATWQDLYQDGSQVRLHSTNNVVSIYGLGTYRVAKESSTNAAGLFLNRQDTV